MKDKICKIFKLIGLCIAVIIACVVFYNATIRYKFVPVAKGVMAGDRWSGRCEYYEANLNEEAAYMRKELAEYWEKEQVAKKAANIVTTKEMQELTEDFKKTR